MRMQVGTILAPLVNAIFNYCWNQTDKSRTNAIGFTVNQNDSVTLERAGNGTFTVQAIMIEPKNITINSTKQFTFVVTGGYNLIPSVSSPTKDNFYDSGTNLTFTTNRDGPLTNGNSRETLTSYSIDGISSNISTPESISFTTPTISINNSHQLTFDSTLQYFGNAKIMVEDYLGLPIANAKVFIVLANGTKLQTNSEADGSANFQMIPVGTFLATAINFGISAFANGDTSTSSASRIELIASYPTFALIIITLFVIVAAGYFRYKRKQKIKMELIQQQIA